MTSATFSARERRALRILIVITVISRLALAFRPEWQIATRPFQEDSFYIFTVAEHIAHGDGLTVDGVHPTNGVQPLIAFIYAPFFAIAGSNHWLGVRLCFIVVALCDVLSVLLIALLVRSLMRKIPSEEKIIWLHPPILAALCWTGLHSVMTHTMNGLETGLYSTLLLACCLAYVRLRGDDARPRQWQWFCFGILLGVTVLARIDAVFLVAAFVVVELWRYKLGAIKTSLTFGATSVLVSLPWWWYNVSTFGNLMPQSGQSEGVLSTLHENLYRGSIVLGDIISTSLILPNYKLPEWFHYVWLLLALFFVVFLARRTGPVAYLREHYRLSLLLPFAFFGLACIVYYVFFFSAPHFLPRYFHPVRILWLIIVSCVAPLIVHRLRLLYERRRALASMAIGILLIAAFGMTAYGYSYHFLVQAPSDLYRMGLWAEAHPNATIGMCQSGTVGFMSANVVNLDGKVNFEVLQAIQHSDIGKYVVEKQLDYIADWPALANPILRSAFRYGMIYEPFDSIGNVVINNLVK